MGQVVRLRPNPPAYLVLAFLPLMLAMQRYAFAVALADLMLGVRR